MAANLTQIQIDFDELVAYFVSEAKEIDQQVLKELLSRGEARVTQVTVTREVSIGSSPTNEEKSEPINSNCPNHTK